MPTIVKSCNALTEAIRAKFIQIQTYYLADKGEETDWVLTLQLDSDQRIFTLNYCPFCGTKCDEGKPTCRGLIGTYKTIKKDVPVAD